MYNCNCYKKCYCCCRGVQKRYACEKKCPCHKSGVLYGYVPVKLCYKLESTSNPIFPKCYADNILENLEFSSMSGNNGMYGHNNMCCNNNMCYKKD